MESLPEPQKVFCEACRESVGVALSGPRQTYLCLDCLREAVAALARGAKGEKEVADA
ncbi:MAG: hypothetical protein IT374_26090 [Polyangiaceae bacterium]|nr:hypothetical protein [Polyangiaceae bacterium]MCK6549297.1 hypothetical protein [Myxococcota bacterium]